MKYDLSNILELKIAQNQFNHLVLNKRIIELKEIKRTRSNIQNRALHLFFELISQELNNLGLEFTYEGLKGMIINTIYTPEMVKDFIWRPIQRSLYKIESTTELNTSQIDTISNILIKFFGEKGIYLVFPDIKSKLDNENNYDL